MKILVIHNHYLEKGGEDEVVKREVSLLKEHGHQVILYEKSNQDIKKKPFLDKIAFILGGLNFSKAVYEEIEKIVKMQKPDIAHVHNIFICITPSVYFALKRNNVPIVQTLHNYRPFCIKGTFFNAGKICEKCRKKRFFSAILRKCWRNSFVLSFFLARVLYRMDRFLKNIDSYIVLSKSSMNKFIECGLQKKKMHLKPNFLDIDPVGNVQDKNYALFIGRLADYKGIGTLVEAFKLCPSFSLKIVGDGPMRSQVKNLILSCKNIEWLGQLGRDLVFELISNSSFIIFPSECYETMGGVIIESFSFSKPVLASNLGAMRELISDGVNGVLFNPGDPGDLAKKAHYLFSHNKERLEMGKNASKYYRERFSREENYRNLMDIYTATIESSSKNQ